MTDSTIPRRIDILRNTPAELAIRAAVDAVERMGAHTLLTEAVVLLGQALNKVADYVDEQEAQQSDALVGDWNDILQSAASSARERLDAECARIETEYAAVPDHLRSQMVNARLRVDGLARVLGAEVPPVLVLNAATLLRRRMDALAAALNDAYSSHDA